MSVYKLLRHDINVNKDPFELICKTINVKNVHDYKIQANLDYIFKSMKKIIMFVLIVNLIILFTMIGRLV